MISLLKIMIFKYFQSRRCMSLLQRRAHIIANFLMLAILFI